MKRSECIWNQKGYCLFTKWCPKKCDWEDLPFNKEAIEKRISKEKRKIKYFMIVSRTRRKKQINDLSYGIFFMYNILEKEFGIPNPITKEIKAMNEDEKIDSNSTDSLVGRDQKSRLTRDFVRQEK